MSFDPQTYPNEAERVLEVTAVFHGTQAELAGYQERITTLLAEVGGQAIRTAIYDEEDRSDSSETTSKEHELHPKLDIDFIDVIERAPFDSNATRLTANSLKKLGIHTLRDVLVYGREEISHSHNIGTVRMNIIENRVVALCGDEFDWLDDPDMSDFVRLCDDIDQLPAFKAVDYAVFPGQTLEQLVAMTDEELAQQVQRVAGMNGSFMEFEPDYARAKSILSAAKEKAAMFRRQKSALKAN